MRLFTEEVDKITSLVIGLSSRLAKASLVTNNQQDEKLQVTMMTMVVMMMNSKVREANNHFNRATAYKKKIEEEGNRVRQKYGQKFCDFS